MVLCSDLCEDSHRCLIYRAPLSCCLCHTPSIVYSLIDTPSLFELTSVFKYVHWKHDEVT